MKRVKGVRRATHKLVTLVVKDYYGTHYGNWKNIVSSIEGEKVDLTEEEKADVFCIKTNLTDPTYTDSFK